MHQRRDFLRSLTALTSALMLPKLDALGQSATRRDRWGELLPLRKFGKTGEQVTMLGVGGSHVGHSGEKAAQEIIETAIAGGVRFFDNAESYQGGQAERFFGRFLVPKYRDEVYIMTKSTGKTKTVVQEHLESSRKRMNLDVIDLFQIHSITSPGDVDSRIENEVLDFVLEAQAKGIIRHVGFTGHRDYRAHQHMLKQTSDLQTCQMPINLFDPNYKSFILNVLPLLVEQDIGVIAMKTLSNGGFFGGTTHFQHGDNPKIIPKSASIEEALHFVWSLPVSVLVTGAESGEMLQEKIDLAKAFVGMEEATRDELIARVSGFDGSKVEFYKG